MAQGGTLRRQGRRNLHNPLSNSKQCKQDANTATSISTPPQTKKGDTPAARTEGRSCLRAAAQGHSLSHLAEPQLWECHQVRLPLLLLTGGCHCCHPAAAAAGRRLFPPQAAAPAVGGSKPLPSQQCLLHHPAAVLPCPGRGLSPRAAHWQGLGARVALEYSRCLCRNHQSSHPHIPRHLTRQQQSSSSAAAAAAPPK